MNTKQIEMLEVGSESLAEAVEDLFAGANESTLKIFQFLLGAETPCSEILSILEQVGANPYRAIIVEGWLANKLSEVISALREDPRAMSNPQAGALVSAFQSREIDIAAIVRVFAFLLDRITLKAAIELPESALLN